MENIPAEQLVIIAPRIEIWSGTVQIERSTDLAAVNGQLPPKGLVSDGRKQLIPTTPLRPLHNVRKQMERSLKAEGFTGLIGSGVAVTPEKAEEFLRVELPRYEQEFAAGLDALVRDLDFHYETQERAYPTWQTMLREARLGADAVRLRCKFGVAVFRLASPVAEAGQVADEVYRDMTQSALPILLQEVAGEAEVLMERIAGRATIKQSQVAPVKRLVGKLKGFAFLDPRVQPTTAGLLQILDSLPLAGSLNATQVAQVVTVLQALTNPQSILSHGTGVIANRNQPAPIDDPLEEPSLQEELAIEPPLPIAEAPPALAPPATPVRRRGFVVAF